MYLAELRFMILICPPCDRDPANGSVVNAMLGSRPTVFGLKISVCPPLHINVSPVVVIFFNCFSLLLLLERMTCWHYVDLIEYNPKLFSRKSSRRLSH